MYVYEGNEEPEEDNTNIGQIYNKDICKVLYQLINKGKTARIIFLNNEIAYRKIFLMIKIKLYHPMNIHSPHGFTLFL